MPYTVICACHGDNIDYIVMSKSSDKDILLSNSYSILSSVDVTYVGTFHMSGQVWYLIVSIPDLCTHADFVFRG